MIVLEVAHAPYPVVRAPPCVFQFSQPRNANPHARNRRIRPANRAGELCPGRGETLHGDRWQSGPGKELGRCGCGQELTVLTIDDIVADGISLITGNAPAAKETPAEEEGVATEAAEAEAPVSEATETHTEQSTSRRRRTVKAEDMESNAEEEEE